MSRLLTMGIPGGFNPRRIAGCKLWFAANRGTLYKYSGNANGNVAGAADNGAGLIRIMTAAPTAVETHDEVIIAAVGGTTEANGTWPITYVDATHFDLEGSAFANTYTSGGTWNANGMLATIDGAFIGKVADLSGQGNHATQATRANQPRRYNSIVNGQPVVRFDGVNDILNSVLTLAQPMTIFHVYKWTDNAAAIQAVYGGATTGLLEAYHANATSLFTHAGTSYSPAGGATSSAFRVIDCIFNGTSSQIWENGTQIGATGNAGTNGIATAFSIGNRNAADKPTQMDLAELIVYNTALSTSNRRKVERYLGRRYGITVV